MRLMDHKYVKFGLYKIKEPTTIDLVLNWSTIASGIIVIILMFASIKIEVDKGILGSFAVITTALIIFIFIRNVGEDIVVIIGHIELNYDSIKIRYNNTLNEYKREDVQSLKVVFSSIKGEYRPTYGTISSDTETGLFNEFYMKVNDIRIKHEFIILSKSQLIILKRILEFGREDNSNIVFKKVSGNNLLVYDKKDWFY